MISSGRGAEILGISIHEFLELLERKGVSFNWYAGSIKEYMEENHGE
jgi:predicted HTH domain antitoxin